MEYVGIAIEFAQDHWKEIVGVAVVVAGLAAALVKKWKQAKS